MRDCECGKPKRKSTDECCPACRALDEQRWKVGDYRQVVLNALRWFDWCDGDDLRAALEVDGGTREAGRLSSYLCKMVREGVLESRKTPGMGTSYRLVGQQRRAA